MELIGISFAWNGGPTAAKIATVDSAGEPAPAADTTAAPTEEPFVPRCVRISVLTRNAHTPTRSHAHALTTSHAQMRRRPRCCASAYDHCEGFAAQVSVTAPPRRQVNATSTFRRTDGCQGGCGCGCTPTTSHAQMRRRPRCCASAYDHCEGFAAQVSVTAPPRRQVNATSTFRRTDGCQGGCGCGCTRSHAHSLTRSHHNTLTRSHAHAHAHPGVCVFQF